MKTFTLILFGTILLNFASYAQNEDTVQPDSLYRKYKIHFRSSHQGNYSKSKQIFVFNKSGYYAGFILTDNETGKKPQLIIAYEHDSTGKLTAEHDTTYRSRGAEVQSAELNFGTNGEMTKKTMKSNGNIISEIEYFPKEKKETESLFRNERIYRVQTTYYDGQHKKVRFTGTEKGDTNAKPRVIELNGKKFTIPAAIKDEEWDYEFQNSYDNKSNLIMQKRLVNNVVQDETTFTYDTRGLLITKKQSNHSDSEIFEYQYY